jgi:hypothetical protein
VIQYPCYYYFTPGSAYKINVCSQKKLSQKYKKKIGKYSAEVNPEQRHYGPVRQLVATAYALNSVGYHQQGAEQRVFHVGVSEEQLQENAALNSVVAAAPPNGEIAAGEWDMDY